MLNQSSPSYLPVTIIAGQSLSPEINLGAETLHGIIIPNGWIAAGLTFQASPDGGTTWYEIYNATGDLAIAATAGGYIALDPTLWRAINCLKIRSGTLGSPVVQTSAALLTLVLGTVV